MNITKIIVYIKTNDDMAFENNNTEKVNCVNIAGRKQRQVYHGRQRAF